MRSHVGRVMVKVPEESLGGEERNPVVTRLDIDVSGFLEIIGRGREQDRVGMTTQIGDRSLGFMAGHVLQNLGTHDQVVVAVQLLGEETHPAIGSQCVRYLFDRPRRNIDAMGVHAAFSEFFDEEAYGTSGIKNRLGPDLLDDSLRYGAEKVRPVRFAPTVRRREQPTGLVPRPVGLIVGLVV